jgi:ABC-type Fe3+-siderophore transport system permease subunit
MIAPPESKGRATINQTLFVCGLLLIVLAAVFLIASVIGSQRLPLAASLCALAGRSNCGLSPEQQAILFDLRLPRNL